MNNTKILTVILAVLMAGALFALAGPAAAQDVAPDQTEGEINLSLQPSEAELAPGEEQLIDIVVQDADDGIDGYNVNVTLDNHQAFQITGWNEVLFERAAADPGATGPFSQSNVTLDGQIITPEDYFQDGSSFADDVAEGGDTLFFSAAAGDLGWGAEEADEDGNIVIGSVLVQAVGSPGDQSNLDFAAAGGEVNGESFSTDQEDNLDAILSQQEEVYNESEVGSSSLTVAEEATADLNVDVDPGVEDTENDFTLTSNASDVDDDTDIHDLEFDFGGSGVDVADIGVDQVTVTADGASPGVDDTQENNGNLLITVENTFTLDEVTGDVVVTIDDVVVPENGTFTGTLEYQDDANEAVDSASDEYTIASTEASSALSNLAIGDQGDDATITEGDNVPISVDVENDGTAAGAFDVDLEINGNTWSESTDTLEPGQSETVTFTGATEGLAPDSYSVDVSTDDDAVTGGLEVVESQPANFQLDNLVPQDATVTEGDTVGISVEVTNVGDEEGTQDIVLDINGYSDSVTETLESDETETVGFNVDSSELGVGNFTHTVSTDNDSVSGELTVEEAPPRQPGPEPPEEPDQWDETHVDDIVVTGGHLDDGDNGNNGDVGAAQVSDVTNIDGLTIIDDFPRNGSAIYAPIPDSIYDGTQAPIPSGQHTGVVGVPVQTDAYEDYEALLNHFTDEPGQEVHVTLGVTGNEQQTFTVDFGEVYASGMQINASESTFSAPNAQSISYDNGVVSVTYENADGVSDTIALDLVYEPQDAVEGLDVPGEWDDPRVIANSPNNNEWDRFVLAEVGATGISFDDSQAGFVGSDAEDTDPIRAYSDANAQTNPGSFLIWQDQKVTFETYERGDELTIYETAVDEGEWVKGDEVTTLGTDPGQVANLDTSTLDPGQYFVDFDNTPSGDVVVLDVRPLDLAAEAPEQVAEDEEIEIDVTSEDTTDVGDIEAWFWQAGDSEVKDVIHVEEDFLRFDGDRTMYIDPEDELAGPGDYYATILHKESEVTVTTDVITVADPEDEMVPADDVDIVSPSLTDPAEPGVFDRGDIIPIELEFEGGNVGTITFGDREENRNNIEINVTVWDEDNSGDATIYLNTYQIGHGLLNDGGAMVDNQAPWETGAFEDRQHGFFTDPADDGSNITGDVAAHHSMDIFGGSQGGAVLADIRYDFHSIGGFDAFKEVGDRSDVNNIEIAQRATDSFTLWTAPGVGDDAPVLTTEADVEAAIEDGTLTEIEAEWDEDAEEYVIDGTVAENDYLIVQADSSGLEGVMHEAVVRNADLTVDGFLDRSEDHFVTEEFVNATQEVISNPQSFPDPIAMLEYGITVEETTSSFEHRMGEVPPNVAAGLEPVELDLGIPSVLAGEGESGSLYDYYIPYQLTPGDSLTAPPSDDLEGGQQFNVSLALEPNGGAQDFEPGSTYRPYNVPADDNPPLSAGSLGVSDYTHLDYVTPLAEIDNLRQGVLEVPPFDDSVAITGTSTMAPGTTLDIELLSVVGEDTPFFERQETVDTVAEPGAQPASWEITVGFLETRDGVQIEPGTEFEVSIRRAGSTGLVTADGEPVPGKVLEEAQGDITFSDQRTSGSSVVIDEFDANRDATIQLINAEGDVIGESAVLDRDAEHETFAVSIDEPLTEDQDVEAVALVDNPPAEAGDVLANATASLDVVDDEPEPDPAEFRLSNVQPSSQSVAQDGTITLSVDVENIGDETGAAELALSADGTELATASEDIAGGAEETVTFSDVEHELGAGEYTLTVSVDDRTATAALTVEPEPAEFEVSNLDPADATIDEDESLTVSADITNVGEAEDTTDVELRLDGDTQATTAVTLAGGASDSVEFTIDAPAPGEYEHSVWTEDDEATGSLTVDEVTVDEDEDEDEDDADDDGAGFGIVVASIALIGAALLAYRRQVE